MRPVVEFRVMDANAMRLGITIDFLMEEAGKAVAKTVTDRFGSDLQIAVVCGTGSNAGDGFVAARHLMIDNHVTVFTIRPWETIKEDVARHNAQRIPSIIRPLEEMELEGFDVVIDALLGTGIAGDIRPPYDLAIRAINQSGSKIVSVDLPSGLGAAQMVRPDITVTFHDSKEGMSPETCGEIVVVPIGLPEEADLYTGPGEFLFYPRPRLQGHKGENGRVLVIAGGPYTGAPVLAALGAMRSGADLVHLAVPSRIFIPVAAQSPDIIVHALDGERLSPDNVPMIRELMTKVDAVLIGPGLGHHPETIETVRLIVSHECPPLVLDADALRAVDADVLLGKEAVLTPHRGEFVRLSGDPLIESLEGRMGQVKAAASKLGTVLLVKGDVDIISDGSLIKLCRDGNPSMTVGGTGDVLAGVVTALLSKGLTPFQAARLGAYINGYTGDLTFEAMSHSILASDIIEHMPITFKEHLEEKDQ